MKKTLFTIGKVVVTLGLVFWLIERVDWNGVWMELAEVSLPLLFLYVILQLAGNLISARKWQIIANGIISNPRMIIKEGYSLLEQISLFHSVMTSPFTRNFEAA